MILPESDLQVLCASDELIEGGLACPFDVRFQGQTCRAFAVRYEGQVHAYVNRCSHVAMELDWRANHVFEETGQYLVCASHGAMFRPDTGECVAGPGRGPLIKIDAMERDGRVFWRAQYNLQAIDF